MYKQLSNIEHIIYCDKYNLVFPLSLSLSLSLYSQQAWAPVHERVGAPSSPRSRFERLI